MLMLVQATMMAFIHSYYEEDNPLYSMTLSPQQTFGRQTTGECSLIEYECREKT